MLLRDYQIEIATKAKALLKNYGIAYLSMQVRTGKTLTALHAADLYGSKSVLFVTKKKAMSSIEHDYKALAPNYVLHIVNYESIHKHKYKPDLVILDEAHCLQKYPKPALRTKQLKELCNGLPIIYLSGTPTPESFSQIYHQLWVSSFSPFQHVNFYKWAYEFVSIRKKYVFNRQLNDYSHANEALVKSKIKHLLISYTQKEAGFDMPVNEHILKVKMNDSTYNLANKLRLNKVFIGYNGSEILADTEVKMMQKLHQIYSGTVIDEDGNYIPFDNSKAKYIAKRFKGKKIAIFYKYKAEEQLLRDTFDNITTLPDEFNRSKDMVFISQVQSGREGINLATADCLVMFNICFSSVSYWQSRARLQTKDRAKTADVYWIFSEGGIEEKIYKVVLNKKDYTTSYFKNDF